MDPVPVGSIEQQNPDLDVQDPEFNKTLEYNEDGEYYRDVYQYIDFSKSNFIYLPPGDCVITFTSSDDANVYASVELMEYYETV